MFNIHYAKKILRSQDLSDNRRKGKKYSMGLGQPLYKDRDFYFSARYEVRVHYVYISKTIDVMRCRDI